MLLFPPWHDNHVLVFKPIFLLNECWWSYWRGWRLQQKGTCQAHRSDTKMEPQSGFTLRMHYFCSLSWCFKHSFSVSWVLLNYKCVNSSFFLHISLCGVHFKCQNNTCGNHFESNLNTYKRVILNECFLNLKDFASGWS